MAVARPRPRLGPGRPGPRGAADTDQLLASQEPCGLDEQALPELGPCAGGVAAPGGPTPGPAASSRGEGGPGCRVDAVPPSNGSLLLRSGAPPRSVLREGAARGHSGGPGPPRRRGRPTRGGGPSESGLRGRLGDFRSAPPGRRRRARRCDRPGRQPVGVAPPSAPGPAGAPAPPTEAEPGAPERRNPCAPAHGPATGSAGVGLPAARSAPVPRPGAASPGAAAAHLPNSLGRPGAESRAPPLHVTVQTPQSFRRGSGTPADGGPGGPVFPAPHSPARRPPPPCAGARGLCVLLPAPAWPRPGCT